MCYLLVNNALGEAVSTRAPAAAAVRCFYHCNERGGDRNEEECIEIVLCTAAGACENNHWLLEETAEMALLDSGCHRRVCGERWLSNFTSSLSEKERRCINIAHSSASDHFGNDEQKKALRCVSFLCRFKGKRVNIKTDVIVCAVSLLMSSHSMKAAGSIINMPEDTAVVFGNTVILRTTSTGHYTLPLFSDDPHYGSQLPLGVCKHSSVPLKAP